MPDLAFESAYEGLVAGVDEAGRGPWAGPVVAAAAILDRTALPNGINDSKQLSEARREALFNHIMASAMVGVGIASVEEIDSMNILAATKLAMKRAVEQLPQLPAIALVDGNQPPKLPCPVKTIVKGDSLSLSIAAASIIAKVTRDRIMKQLAAEFPGYGWESNAGYGTQTHQNGLATLGVTIHHRRSFKPIKALLEQQVAA